MWDFFNQLEKLNLPLQVKELNRETVGLLLRLIARGLGTGNVNQYLQTEFKKILDAPDAPGPVRGVSSTVVKDGLKRR